MHVDGENCDKFYGYLSLTNYHYVTEKKETTEKNAK